MSAPVPALTTTVKVATRLRLGTDQAALDDVAEETAAVNALVARWITHPSGGWSADHQLGALMLAVRLYRRRDSPAGVESFGADGPAYVQRNDPDVAMLLGLGSYAPPVVG